MGLIYKEGDASRIRSGIILHIVNDIGVWGGGFTGALEHRWPGLGTHYQKYHKLFSLGDVQYVAVTKHITVANMFGQRNVRDRYNLIPLRYGSLMQCLKKVRRNVLSSFIKGQLHMPRIGSGLAGGDWDRISSMIDDTLGEFNPVVWTLPVVPTTTKKKKEK